MSLHLVPLTQREAVRFIARHHRHHRPPRGDVIRVGVADDGALVGVATAGRPVSRHLDDGRTLEVTRVATDGTRNACSALYGAIRRAAVALGYTRLVTYTLAEEEGASLRASGWTDEGEAGSGSWSRPSRPRDDTLFGMPAPKAAPQVRKRRWMWHSLAQRSA